MKFVQMTKIKLVIGAGVLLAVASLWLIPGPDRQGATVRVEADEVIHQGQHRQATVVVDSNVEVNAADIVVKYDGGSLKAVDASMETGVFATTVFEPQIDAGAQTVRFVQAALTPFNGDGAVVGYIEFEAIQQTEPEFDTSQSKIIRHDGSGSNVYQPALTQSVGQWVWGMITNDR